jgi:UDP-N-acetylglucosamine--N-acetylmuramyl-(pentapeptide) pyrophosphoryl-undecaprenol N-acetylglucosamine transferase
LTTVVLSAGGTGGHLFPAQALAAELESRGRKIVVMTDARGSAYDMHFPGATIEIVPAATFADRSKLRLMAVPFEILAGVFVSLAKLARIRPRAVVGFGGYPSVPVMLAAIIARLPTAILAPDAVLGRANRLVANSVKVIAGGLPLVRFLPKDMSKVVYTGNPLRPEVIAQAGAPYRMPLSGEPLNMLVFGGSQGARALSEIVPAAVALLPAELRNRLEIVQQCRPEDLESVRAIYAKAGIKAELAPFFEDIPERMARAHLVIGRSGVGTVSELAAIGRPSILVPYPFATDDHQTANARVMADAGAAWLIPQPELTADNLATLLAEILDSPTELAKRAQAALALGKPDAARRLADLVDSISGGAA